MKIQALLPLRSCRRRSFFPKKGASWKKQHVISEKMRLYLWIQPPEVPGPAPGGSSALKYRKLHHSRAFWNTAAIFADPADPAETAQIGRAHV